MLLLLLSCPHLGKSLVTGDALESLSLIDHGLFEQIVQSRSIEASLVMLLQLVYLLLVVERTDIGDG